MQSVSIFFFKFIHPCFLCICCYLYVPSTPHVSVCVWKWRFFSLWFGLSSTRVGENGQRKRIFSNHSPEPKFSKTPFAGLVWMQEKRIRRGVGSTILPRARDETKCPCSNQRRYHFQSLLHCRLEGKKRFKNATWEEKRRKKSPLSNKNGYVWTGTNWVKKLNVHTFWQHTHLSSSSRWTNFLSKLSTFNRWS